MKKSVGIIPFKINDNGELVFFVGHPGGNSRNYWTYLKGGVEDDENEIETALREFREESGVSLDMYKDNLIYLGQTIQNPKKEVAAYGMNLTDYFDIDPDKCVSNLCEKGWPEIDKYRWMKWEDLEPVTHPKHKLFYETIMHKAK